MVNPEVLTSPYMARYMTALREAGSPWKFGIEDPESFFRQHGWSRHGGAARRPGGQLRPLAVSHGAARDARFAAHLLRHRVPHDMRRSMRTSRELSTAQRAALEGVAAAAKIDSGGFVLLAGGAGAAGASAAEALASLLGTTVYRIDLAALISKYLGETEKHLGLLLAEAEAAGAVLLVDDADELFGKRTDVKDAHDRYANLETSHLLARIEAYTGAVVLATNLRTARDTAKIRRPLRVIDYPPR